MAKALETVFYDKSGKFSTKRFWFNVSHLFTWVLIFLGCFDVIQLDDSRLTIILGFTTATFGWYIGGKKVDDVSQIK